MELSPAILLLPYSLEGLESTCSKIEAPALFNLLFPRSTLLSDISLLALAPPDTSYFLLWLPYSPELCFSFSDLISIIFLLNLGSLRSVFNFFKSVSFLAICELSTSSASFSRGESIDASSSANGGIC